MYYLAEYFRRVSYKARRYVPRCTPPAFWWRRRELGAAMKLPPSSPAAASPAGLTPFESYYRKQRIVPDEEWPAFAAALQSPLPLDVRVSHRAPLASRAFERLVALLPDANERPLPWAGSGVWQLDRPAEPSLAPHRDGRGDGSYQPARARSVASPSPPPQRATPDGYHQFLHRQQRGALTDRSRPRCFRRCC